VRQCLPKDASTRRRASSEITPAKGEFWRSSRAIGPVEVERVGKSVDSRVEHLLPLTQPVGGHPADRVLRPQSLEVLLHACEDPLRVCNQLGHHCPVQPQRPFLIARQITLSRGSEEPVQLEPWNATM